VSFCRACSTIAGAGLDLDGMPKRAAVDGVPFVEFASRGDEAGCLTMGGRLKRLQIQTLDERAQAKIVRTRHSTAPISAPARNPARVFSRSRR